MQSASYPADAAIGQKNSSRSVQAAKGGLVFPGFLSSTSLSGPLKLGDPFYNHALATLADC